MTRISIRISFDILIIMTLWNEDQERAGQHYLQACSWLIRPIHGWLVWSRQQPLKIWSGCDGIVLPFLLLCLLSLRTTLWCFQRKRQCGWWWNSRHHSSQQGWTSGNGQFFKVCDILLLNKTGRRKSKLNYTHKHI